MISDEEILLMAGIVTIVLEFAFIVHLLIAGCPS